MNSWARAGRIALLAVSFQGLSQAQTSDDARRVDAEASAKDFSAEWAKNFCVSQWTEPDRLNMLTRVGGSVAELCKCSEQSFRSMVSSDLAMRLVDVTVEDKQRPQGAERSDASIRALREFAKLYTAAVAGCGEKVLRQK